VPLPLPLIDVKPLLGEAWDRPECSAVAAELGRACREAGFFYIVGHGVDEALQQRLAEESARFFAQDLKNKLAIHMPLGGRAWRGYFPVGEELTSGKPDLKEGIYFGEELSAAHPRVRAGTPLHGANLFPAAMPEFKECVLLYMRAMTELGHRLMAGIALSLGLPASYFATHYTATPLTLFRVFNYPPTAGASGEPRWGVSEHTDYGLLTILLQDRTSGLQIRSRSGWIDAPPVPGSFVCNIGDMLDRMTAGRYRSTPHRVRNVSGRSRLSFPFFFDPDWDAEVAPIIKPGAGSVPGDAADERWDYADLQALTGTYGEYLLTKVGRVFPDLQKVVL
jgi:isopenicillin N synthase-like dioxygenase